MNTYDRRMFLTKDELKLIETALSQILWKIKTPYNKTKEIYELRERVRDRIEYMDEMEEY